MTSRNQGPAGYNSIPTPSDPEHIRKGYGGSSSGLNGAPTPGPRTAAMADNAQMPPTTSQPSSSSPLARSVERQDFEPGKQTPDTSAFDGDASQLARGASVKSSGSAIPSRGGTLKKKDSMGRRSSLKQSDSKKSERSGSVKSLILGHSEKMVVGDEDNMRSVYYTPVPTSGTPTEVLATRFQGETSMSI